MSAEKATALVLRITEFSETSYVTALLTREFGRISVLAKGARRPKNPFDSALDLLTHCRILFLRKSSGGLDLLTEARLERRFRPPRGELARLYAGYYVAELLLSLTDEYDPHPELFDVADATLSALGQSQPPVGAVVLWFELAALRLLGHLPSLEMCVECGGKVDATKRVAFGQLVGGVLCERCRPGKRQVVSLSSAALQVLARFATIENGSNQVVSEKTGGLTDVTKEATWRVESVPSGIMGEVRGVLNHYLRNLLGHKPQMHEYLGVLGK